MNALVYGAGAVGLSLAGCLVASDFSLDLIARPATVTALRSGGILRSGCLGDLKVPPDSFCAFASPDQITRTSPYDFVLITAKSFDSEAIARELARNPRFFASHTRIVLFQNGWGNREVFESALPGRHVLNARVITGFRRPEPHRVEVTVHADAIRVGSLVRMSGQELQQSLDQLARALTAGGIPCQVELDVEKHIWAKMLYNCALNPLGAIFGCSYGELASNEATRSIMNGIFAETFNVMRAEGRSTLWPDAPSYQRAFYEELIPPTAAHEPSTLQDIRAGRRTEIDALNGAVVRLGELRGVPTPLNASLCSMIKFLEQRNRVGP